MHIKTNQEIKNMQDVSNLITSIILRQTGTYTDNDVSDIARYWLAESPLNLSDHVLLEMIGSALDVMQRNALIVCKDGVYRTIPA